MGFTLGKSRKGKVERGNASINGKVGRRMGKVKRAGVI